MKIKTISDALSVHCKNKTLTDQYIHKYQTATSNAVESILNMGLAVRDVYLKSKNGELDEFDLLYFCESVGLKPKSSTFRKYKCIGEKAHIFKDYLEYMPQSFSTLYEIATLDADTFDRMYVTGSTSPKITLAGVKEMAKKSNSVPARNKISKHNPNYLSRKTFSKVAKEMNRYEFYIYSTVSKEKRNELLDMLYKLQEDGLIRFEIPNIEEFIEDESDEFPLAA